MKKYKFKASDGSLYDVIIVKERYFNNQTALQLYDFNNHDLVLVITICVPELFLEEDEMVIKNYSENEGIMDFLLEYNIVKMTFRTVQVGYVQVPIVKLLSPAVWK